MSMNAILKRTPNPPRRICWVKKGVCKSHPHWWSIVSLMFRSSKAMTKAYPEPIYPNDAYSGRSALWCISATSAFSNLIRLPLTNYHYSFICVYKDREECELQRKGACFKHPKTSKYLCGVIFADSSNEGSSFASTDHNFLPAPFENDLHTA